MYLIVFFCQSLYNFDFLLQNFQLMSDNLDIEAINFLQNYSYNYHLYDVFVTELFQ